MKNRRIKSVYFAGIIILAITAVLLAIFLTDSGMHRRESNIVLPGHDNQNDRPGIVDIPSEETETGREVKIDTDNVLSVIKAMHRPEKYYLEMETAVYYGESSRTTQIKHWVSEGNSVTRRMEEGTSEAVYVMRTDESVKIWRENSADVYTSMPAGLSEDDAAGIMTYEDVLKESGTLVSAKYTELEGMRCIYVAARDKLLGYTREYYIDVDTGLLVKSLIKKAGETVYSMSVSFISEDEANMEKVFEGN